MMVNLTNLKHVLKKNFNDSELLDTIASFGFIDDLASRHLRILKGQPVRASRKEQLVPRDEEAF